MDCAAMTPTASPGCTMERYHLTCMRRWKSAGNGRADNAGKAVRQWGATEETRAEHCTQHRLASGGCSHSTAVSAQPNALCLPDRIPPGL